VLVWTIATAPEEEDVELETETVTGPSVTRTFDEPGVYPVTLVATNDDDETITLERRVVVGESLWDTLWTTFDTVNDSETFGVSALTLTLLQYRLDFSLDDGGARDRVRISWGSEVPSTMRFLGGGITQGRVEYSLAIAFAASSIQLEGPLAAAVDVQSVRGTYEYGRQYTPSVLTSDRRRRDPVQERPLPTPVETVQRGVTEDGDRRPVPEAAGLSMKPASPTSIRLADVEVETQLAAPARVVGWLIGVLAALGLAAAAVTGVVAALIATTGIVVAVGIALGALVGILITLGLTWLLIEVIAPPLLQWAANGMVRSNLEEGAAGIREALDDQRFLTYAGEGLAEGIAGQVIAGAQAQGFELDDPGRLGRHRHRHAFFETIFVSDGLCRVRVRVPPP